jgi:hypothetical protein
MVAVAVITVRERGIKEKEETHHQDLHHCLKEEKTRTEIVNIERKTQKVMSTVIETGNIFKAKHISKT